MTVGTSKVTVGEAVAAALTEVGVRSAFGLMGEDTATLVTAFVEEHGGDFFAARHESAGVMAAEGYAWASGELGVAVLSHGPGFTNGLTAAVTAVKYKRPVLIVAGSDPTRPRLRPELKGLDQEAVAAAVGLNYVGVGAPAEAVDAVHRAVGWARAGRPTLLAVPVDVFDAEFEGSRARTDVVAGTAGSPVAGEPSPRELEQILGLLESAKRPLILCGRGGIAAKSALEAIAEQSGALLGTSLLARDLFRGHRLNLGVVGGWASEAAKSLLGTFDVVLVFGASLTSFTTEFGRLLEQATVVQIDIDSEQVGKNFAVQVGVVADAQATAAALLDRLGDRLSDPQLHQPEVLDRISQQHYAGEDESSEEEIDPRVLAMILNEALPERRVLVSDGGHFMGFPGMYVRGLGPDRYRHTVSFASIGLGIGAAIGASVARPTEPTVLFVGDGGMMMSLGDLETVARYRIPLTVIVMDDRALGAERHTLDLMDLSHDQVVYGDVDFAGVARALGIESETIRTREDLRAIAEKLSKPRDTPLLLDCKIRGDVRARWLDEMRDGFSSGETTEAQLDPSTSRP